MTTDERVLFYGDFNCPFCFAQHERIERIGLSSRVDFRPIQHMPELSTPMSDADAAMLREEVDRVRARAPDVPITLPAGRPNTSAAALIYAAARRSHPANVHRFARQVFRALWLHGQDISNAEMLEQMAGRLGFAFAIDARVRDDVSRWQSSWQSGEFDRRLPSLASPRGGTLLGLADQSRLTTFLSAGMMSSETDDFC